MHPNKIPANISPKLAYLCGILAGDGSIYCRKEKSDYIIKCVGNPKDEKGLYTKIIKPYFKELFGINLNVKLQDGGTTFGFVIYSKELFEYFTKSIGLNDGRKTELEIPDLIRNNHLLSICFIKGLFDTDGCISFKKRQTKKPYYPVISLSSKSKKLIEETSKILKEFNLKVVEIYDYKVFDKRLKQGFNVINRIEMNGFENLQTWMGTIGFLSPKHLSKIKKYWKESSGRWI